MITSKKTKHRSELFYYLLFFTAFFLLAQISFFIQCNKVFFLDFTSTLSDNFIFPFVILPGIFYAILLQLGLHFTFCVLIWILTCLVLNSSFLKIKNPIHIAIIIWSLGIISICIANQVYFPNSIYAELTRAFLPQTIAKFLLLVLFFFDIVVFLLALMGLVKTIQNRRLFVLSIFL